MQAHPNLFITIKYNKEEKMNYMESAFLSNLLKSKTIISVYLLSGIKIAGELFQFDDNSLLIRHKDKYNLVYKHAIASILPDNYNE